MSQTNSFVLDVGQPATINYVYTIPPGGPTPPPIVVPSTDPSFTVQVDPPVQSDSNGSWSSLVTVTGVAVNQPTGAQLIMTEDGNPGTPVTVLVGPDPTDTGAFDFTSLQYGPVP